VARPDDPHVIDDPLLLVAVDVVAWAAFHASTGYLVHRLPACRFASDTFLTRPRRFEGDGRLYTRTFAIKRWKGRLPEAGGLFAGGFDKRRLRGSSVDDLERFATETRRAEVGHWLAAAAAPLFFLWNPLAVGAVMLVYAVAANGPCIAAQRYNRLRLVRIIRRARESDGYRGR
jgi:glycosyl-4,4'-diaponeurosporenoate acyltransferase